MSGTKGSSFFHRVYPPYSKNISHTIGKDKRESHKNDPKSKDVGVQYNWRRDNVKSTVTNSGSCTSSSTDIGTIRPVSKKRVRKLHPPVTEDRGVGSTDFTSYIVQRRDTLVEENSNLPEKRTSSKCVGGAVETDVKLAVSQKLSPINYDVHEIIVSKDYTPRPSFTNAQIRSPMVQKKESIIIKEKLEHIYDDDETDITIEITKSSITEREFENDSKLTISGICEKKSDQTQSKVEVVEDASVDMAQGDIGGSVCGEDSSKEPLDQNTHNSDKTSQSIEITVLDNIENNLYKRKKHRNIFPVKSMYNKIESRNTDKQYSDIKISSIFRWSLDAIRRTLGRKRNPTKIVRFVDTSVQNRREKSVFSNSLSRKKNILVKNESIETKSVLESPNESFKAYEELSKELHALAVENSSTVQGSVENKRSKFFFFRSNRHKAKNKNKEDLEPNNRVTTSYCEVQDRLSVKINENANVSTAPAESYDELARKAWFIKYLSNHKESQNSVQVRWNNKTYNTCSSTMFELKETVYKDPKIVMQSRSETMTDQSSHYRSLTKNFNFGQNFQAWMIQKTTSDRPVTVVDKETSPYVKLKNIKVSMSDQKWYIDKSQAFAHNINVVLHSKHFGKYNNVDSDSEYLKIDIPKSFFSDDASSRDLQGLTSDEEVYNVVEYDTFIPTSDVKKIAKTDRSLDTGDHVSKGIHVTVSVKDRQCKAQVLDTVINVPSRRDVVTQGSDVYVAKKCNVIGVGILTQRNIGDVKPKSILKILEYESDDHSERSAYNIAKQCGFAESLLQDVYRNVASLDIPIDMYSLGIGDSNTLQCTETSSGQKKGNRSSSKSNIENNRTQASKSSFSTSSCTAAMTETKNFTKNARFCIPKNQKLIHKDSLFVSKKRQMYRDSNKSKWGDTEVISKLEMSKSNFEKSFGLTSSVSSGEAQHEYQKQITTLNDTNSDHDSRSIKTTDRQIPAEDWHSSIKSHRRESRHSDKEQWHKQVSLQDSKILRKQRLMETKPGILLFSSRSKNKKKRVHRKVDITGYLPGCTEVYMKQDTSQHCKVSTHPFSFSPSPNVSHSSLSPIPIAQGPRFFCSGCLPCHIPTELEQSIFSASKQHSEATENSENSSEQSSISFVNVKSAASSGASRDFMVGQCSQHTRSAKGLSEKKIRKKKVTCSKATKETAAKEKSCPMHPNAKCGCSNGISQSITCAAGNETDCKNNSERHVHVGEANAILANKNMIEIKIKLWESKNDKANINITQEKNKLKIFSLEPTKKAGKLKKPRFIDTSDSGNKNKDIDIGIVITSHKPERYVNVGTVIPFNIEADFSKTPNAITLMVQNPGVNANNSNVKNTSVNQIPDHSAIKKTIMIVSPGQSSHKRTGSRMFETEQFKVETNVTPDVKFGESTGAQSKPVKNEIPTDKMDSLHDVDTFFVKKSDESDSSDSDEDSSDKDDLEIENKTSDERRTDICNKYSEESRMIADAIILQQDSPLFNPVDFDKVKRWPCCKKCLKRYRREKIKKAIRQVVRPKTKQKVQAIEKMLKAILSSDSSITNEPIVAHQSTKLAKDLTLNRMKPSFFKNSSKYLMWNIMHSANKTNIRSKCDPTEKPSSVCCTHFNDECLKTGKIRNRGRLSKRLATDPNNKHCTNKLLNDETCSKKATNETNLKKEIVKNVGVNDESYLLKNENVMMVDVATQDSRYFSGSLNSVHVKSSANSKKEHLIQKTAGSVLDIGNPNHPNQKSVVKSVADKLVATVMQPYNQDINKCAKDMQVPSPRTYCTEEEISRNFEISGDEMLVYLEKKSRKISAAPKVNLNNNRRRKINKEIHDRIIDPADMLQLYETKKAVLQIYAEKNKSQNSEGMVVKLPKFVTDRDIEIGRTYKRVKSSGCSKVKTKIKALDFNG